MMRMNSIVEVVEAYANKRVEEALEVAADTAQELTKIIVESYDRAIDEANEYAAELEAKVAALQDEVCNLVDDNIELLQEIAELKRVLGMVVDDRAELHNVVKDMQEALAEYRIREALGDYYKYFEKEVAEEKEEKELQKTEEKIQPDCCAAGHCGTDKCGGCCKEEEEEFDALEDLFRAMFE